ncbi:LPS-assembly lipoprotein LptE [Kaarinaea lacus]
MMVKNTILALLILTLLLVLQNCGFQPRGSAMPNEVNKVYIDAKSAAEIASLLPRVLRENNIEPVMVKDDAEVVLVLSDEKHDKRVLSVGSAGKVQEFELSYRLHLALTSADGERLGDSQTIVLKRDLSFNETEVLAKSSEEQIIKQDMVEDAAQQIIRRLQFVSLDSPVVSEKQ